MNNVELIDHFEAIAERDRLRVTSILYHALIGLIWGVSIAAIVLRFV